MASVNKARIFVAIVVTLVWAATMLIDAVSTTFTVPAAANGALGLVAYLFGKAFKEAANGGS